MNCSAHSHCPFFFFNDTATTEIYTLSLHDALPISGRRRAARGAAGARCPRAPRCPARRPRTPSSCCTRSEEHTSELQSLRHLVCRLLLEKKKTSHKLPSSTSAAHAIGGAERSGTVD